MESTESCPCGSGSVFGRCCLPVHIGERVADTAEQLMRTRYSAYATGDLDYVWRTWHPRTRPGELTPQPDLVWTGLEIVDVVAGGPGDEHGVVEFRAHHRTGSHCGVLHERSRFALRARRWLYVDGELLS